MKKIARIFYIVGIVYSSISIGVCAILSLIGPIVFGVGVSENDNEATAYGVVLMAIGFTFLVCYIISLIFSIIALKALNRDEKGIILYVLAIVGGVLGTPFSIAAGIISIVYATRLKNEQTNVIN